MREIEVETNQPLSNSLCMKTLNILCCEVSYTSIHGRTQRGHKAHGYGDWAIAKTTMAAAKPLSSGHSMGLFGLLDAHIMSGYPQQDQEYIFVQPLECFSIF